MAALAWCREKWDNQRMTTDAATELRRLKDELGVLDAWIGRYDGIIANAVRRVIAGEGADEARRNALAEVAGVPLSEVL